MQNFKKWWWLRPFINRIQSSSRNVCVIRGFIPWVSFRATRILIKKTAFFVTDWNLRFDAKTACFLQMHKLRQRFVHVSFLCICGWRPKLPLRKTWTCTLMCRCCGQTKWFSSVAWNLGRINQRFFCNLQRARVFFQATVRYIITLYELVSTYTASLAWCAQHKEFCKCPGIASRRRGLHWQQVQSLLAQRLAAMGQRTNNATLDFFCHNWWV